MRSPEYVFRQSVRAALDMAMTASVTTGEAVEIISAAAFNLRAALEKEEKPSE